jgi:hypothetical protein
MAVATPTKTRTVYEQLESHVLPQMEGYTEDLTKHDRQWIEDNPGVPFIHMTRSTGTIIIGLHSADSDYFPKYGETVRYLFGFVGRQHILRDGTSLVERENNTSETSTDNGDHS